MNIQEIAKLAGVSTTTVSKVMNGKDKDISEKTRKRVLKVIEEENYIPYFKFREKEGLKSRFVGLIIKKGNKERESIVVNAEKAAREKSYNLITCYVENNEEAEKSLEELWEKKVAGILIDSEKCLTETYFENASIYLSKSRNEKSVQKVVFYYLLSVAGKIATERLIKEGHEKIACIYMNTSREIYEGYYTAMRNAGLQIQDMWQYGVSLLNDVVTYGVRQCLSEKVTAIVCGSPEIALCVGRAMEHTKTVIPDEISVISVGDDSVLELLEGGITSVRLPAAEIGYDAVNYLIDMICGKKQVEMQREFIPVLVERKSISRPAREIIGEKIVVVGSMNMDITIEVPRIPIDGETQIAEKLYVFPGGKGGNQAVGVGKLGGQVYMIGCLGNDFDGKQLYSSLCENHVHVEGVCFAQGTSSGKAYINVDKRNGESTIVVYQGANRSLSIDQINQCKYLFESATYCLLSLEIPETIVEYTIKFCQRNNTRIILKPSATDKLNENLLKYIDYFIPNESELNTFVNGNGGLEQKARSLRKKGVKNVIVTLGKRGCYLCNEQYSMYFEGTGFQAVDTTGGADSFISALAVCLSEGKNIIYAIGYAIYASGISVTRYGVQPALPDRKAVDIYEDEICSRYHISKGGKYLV